MVTFWIEPDTGYLREVVVGPYTAPSGIKWAVVRNGTKRYVVESLIGRWKTDIELLSLLNKAKVSCVI